MLVPKLKEDVLIMYQKDININVTEVIKYNIIILNLSYK